MKAAASRLLGMPEEKITEFKKGECKTREAGFVCTFEMSITFVDTPSKQELNKGYFFQTGEEWTMDLVG
ncbi:MAG: hypothetical protein GWO24_04050 [Akkermansiaceae bacterium]|nr:hypothetical protein [Akkermansiaceae bacterium]